MRKRNKAETKRNAAPEGARLSEHIKIRHLKSEYPVKDERIKQLSVLEGRFVPCDISSEKDYYLFKYDVLGFYPYEAIRKASLIDKYTFLISAEDLESLTSRFSFSLDPDNILVDAAFRPVVLDRKFSNGADSFVDEYKALIGTTIDDTYSFEDYLKGGDDLFQRNELLSSVHTARTASEISSILSVAADKEREDNKENYVVVKKSSNRVQKILLPVFAVLIVFALGLSIYEHFVKGKINEKYINATEQYFTEDYKSVGKSLSPIDEDKLLESSRYMAATSAVKSSGLNTEQKDNILKAIDQYKTNTDYLNYWVMIGRQNYEGADQYAQKFRDNEHRVFALALRRAQVEKDSSISGTEKTETVNKLDETIKELLETINEDKYGLTEDMEGSVEPDENAGTTEEKKDDSSADDEPKLLD